MLKLQTTTQKRKLGFLNYIYEDERFYALMEQIDAWDLSLMMFFTNARDLRVFLITIKEKFNDVIHFHESVIHFDQYYYIYLCEKVVKELIKKSHPK